jgi:hypothetical protein
MPSLCQGGKFEGSSSPKKLKKIPCCFFANLDKEQLKRSRATTLLHKLHAKTANVIQEAGMDLNNSLNSLVIIMYREMMGNGEQVC